ncbi:YciI family protein [Pseudoduganella sp. LjRoot289]|uniref:YciI family protein n=1 Tax=Pseudoduganella sp. LjRoot289 TaxID=3342314 RepID=UPI003ECCDB1D
MEYLVLIYADEKIYGSMSEQQLGEVMQAYGAYTKELGAAGVLRGGSELAPVHTATTVRVRGGNIACTDGPFAETKEQLGGYYLLDCANLDDAIKWAAKCPSATIGSIEVRPLIKSV